VAKKSAAHAAAHDPGGAAASSRAEAPLERVARNAPWAAVLPAPTSAGRR
jgi:hypothetical protein